MTTDHLALLRRPPMGPDVQLVQFRRQRMHRPQFEIALEDPLHLFAFAGMDHK